MLDSIRTSREARTQSHIHRPTLLVIDAVLQTNSEQINVDILAESIASLVHEIEEGNQQAAITVEEASFALHFRRSKEEVRRALLLLERQGKVKPTGLAGRWAFLA